MKISDLDLRDMGANKWMLISALTVTGNINQSLIDEYLTVPKGFMTDLASIPNWCQSIIQKDDLHKKAAVFHDWLYTLHPCQRKTADDIFLRLMKHLKVPLFKRQAMYYAVRICGGNPWKKKPHIIHSCITLLQNENLNYPTFKEK